MFTWQWRPDPAPQPCRPRRPSPATLELDTQRRPPNPAPWRKATNQGKKIITTIYGQPNLAVITLYGHHTGRSPHYKSIPLGGYYIMGTSHWAVITIYEHSFMRLPQWPVTSLINSSPVPHNYKPQEGNHYHPIGKKLSQCFRLYF